MIEKSATFDEMDRRLPSQSAQPRGANGPTNIATEPINESGPNFYLRIKRFQLTCKAPSRLLAKVLFRAQHLPFTVDISVRANRKYRTDPSIRKYAFYSKIIKRACSGRGNKFRPKINIDIAPARNRLYSAGIVKRHAQTCRPVLRGM
jgi:hypothetical protein